MQKKNSYFEYSSTESYTEGKYKKQVERLAPVDKFPAVATRWQIGVSMPIPWWHTAAT